MERLPGAVSHNGRLVKRRDAPVELLGTRADRTQYEVLVIDAAAKRSWVFGLLGRR
jgi:hypothetical protein